MRTLISAASVLTLAACASLGPPPAAPLEDGAGFAVPEGYDYAREIEGLRAPEAAWWAAFGSEELDALVEAARDANLTLAQGAANVQAARAQLRVAGASFLPQASAGLSAGSDTDRGLDDISATGRLSASYQLDLFGANRAGLEAAAASLDAAEFQQRALELTVQADVASTWFGLLSSRAQLEVARRNLEISERIFRIVEVRYEAGAISGFDVSAQSAQLANARARIPQLGAQITSLETALAILTGAAPQGFAAPDTDVLALALPKADPGLPADLLLRRPDLLQAEANLRAADANIAAARAAFMPGIDLGAGLSSLLTGGGNLVGSLSASVSAPIFSGGRLEGQLEAAEARRMAQLASYRQAILNALRDVDVSLSAMEAAEAREAQLAIAREASADALDAAELRYRSGAGDLTSLLTAQQTFFDASNNYVLARLDRLTAAINLYAALGGGY
ncbi:efflux transporter outer membrane subunit [Hyphomonas sp.]|uniref:efflux transporter outer membrane subunit n=1 Tax=Hyphomonas sp. TaxID=87 RepID=UPI00391C051A